MKGVSAIWKAGDRVSLFVISLVTLLVLLLAGLVLADHSLRVSIGQQATLDASTSAKIVAQEVKLAGEHLYELGLSSNRIGAGESLQKRILVKGQRYGISAVWVFDSSGSMILDSAWWGGQAPEANAAVIRRFAHLVADSGGLQLRGLGREAGTTATIWMHPGALLGEPIVEDGKLTGIAVALINERMLLAPAESGAVSGRAFLALLVDGDTVARTSSSADDHDGRQRASARVPLPGEPSWFVVSGQTPSQNNTRIAMWAVGSTALLLLLFGLVRERRQTIRIAERSVELERLSAELLRANRMKSEFLANVSHELRTPLNAIVGFVDLLRDGGYGELTGRQISPVERIATSAARLRTLVDEVLDVARIAAGRLEVRMEAVGLDVLLPTVVSEIEPLVAERHLAVRICTADDVPKIRTDPTHLRQILINLLGNAVKYTEAGGIELRTRVEQLGPPPRTLTSTGQHAAARTDDPVGWVAIDVADTGIGIAVGDLERIFDEFEQLGSRGPAGGHNHGTGLGLAISRRLAMLLGGDVTVESTVGVGSTFTVWLPIGKA